MGSQRKPHKLLSLHFEKATRTFITIKTSAKVPSTTMHSIINAMNHRRAMDRQRFGVADGLWGGILDHGMSCFFSWSDSANADIDENDYNQLIAIHNEVYGNDVAGYNSDEEETEDETTAPIDTQDYTLADLIGSDEDDMSVDWSNTSSEMATMATPGRRHFSFDKFLHKILHKMRQCWGHGDKDDDDEMLGTNSPLHWIEGVQEVTPCPSMHNAALASKDEVAVSAGSSCEPSAFVKAITNKLEVQKDTVHQATSVSNNDISTVPLPLPARFHGIRPDSSLQASAGTWVIRVLRHSEKKGPGTLRFDLMQQDIGCFIPLYGSEILAPVNCIIDHDPEDAEFQVWTFHHGKEQMLLVDSDSILAHLAVLMGIEAANEDNYYSHFRERQELLVV